MPTALIVEDEREANKLLAMLVQLHGYETESAYDGAEALEKVKNRVPDVVFLDLMLPDLDGYDVCRLLKSSGSTSQVPVIIVTARLAAENRFESFKAGADDYVAKPYTPDQIFEALDQSQIWKEQIAADRVEGQAVIDGQDEGEALRRLAQLRNLLLARTDLGLVPIERIYTAIRTIWSSMSERAHRGAPADAATLAYELTDESLTITIHDDGRWLAAASTAAGRLSSLLAEGGFDEVVVEPGPQRLKLVKRWKPPDAARGTESDR